MEIDNISILDMYNYQKKEKGTKDYEKYLKYLNYYYKFDKKDKKNKYKKAYHDGKLIISDGKDKKKVTIQPAEFIDLTVYHTYLKEHLNTILSNISLIIESNSNITDKNRIEFEQLKKNYVLVQKQLKDIDFIYSEYNKEKEKLELEKMEKGYDLEKYYKKRNVLYESIKTMIETNLKNKLIHMFKENKHKIPSLTIINKIAKENEISSSELEKWFEWIENTYFYLITQKDIYDMEKIIKEKHDNFEQQIKYLIIKKPILENDLTNI